jgi:hypothetical protein
MTGRSWRLLVTLLLLLVAAKFARGQGAVADRSSDFALNLARLRASPVASPPYLSTANALFPVSGGMLELRRIVHSSGIIFSGRVIAIGVTPPFSDMIGSLLPRSLSTLNTPFAGPIREKH